MVHHTVPPPGGPPFNSHLQFIPPTTLAALQKQQPPPQQQQQPHPPQQQPEMVKPVEKPVEQLEPEKHSPEAASSNPPGYASIAAGKENGIAAPVNKNDERSKDEMPTIDDWNADIAKEEEESDSREG